MVVALSSTFCILYSSPYRASLTQRRYQNKHVLVGGVLRDALLMQQNIDAVRDVIAPKVHGSHHLWRIASTSPLEQFCGFSSVSSLMGSAGQGCYVAANNVLDAVVACLYACGVPGKARFSASIIRYI